LQWDREIAAHPARHRDYLRMPPETQTPSLISAAKTLS
jgi:hypothetical protein